MNAWYSAVFVGLALLSGATAQADAVLDQKISQLYQRVAGHFSAPGVAGLPAPQMIAPDLFAIGLKAYCGLLQSDQASKVSNPDHFSIVDYNQSPKVARLFVYDVRQQRMVRTIWTSHGQNSDEAMYLRLAGIKTSLKDPLNQEITRFYAETPQFFSNLPDSGQSSVGMAVADSKTYWSKQIWGGVPQGTSVRMAGVDGTLNDQLENRGVVIHGLTFDSRDLPVFGAPDSLGCVMVDNRIALDVMNDMMGGPVMLYHDRLFPDDNRDAYQRQLGEVTRMENEIAQYLQAQGAKYHWSAQAIAAAEDQLKAKLVPLRRKVEATYQYFRKDSKFITFEPKDPAACARTLGI